MPADTRGDWGLTGLDSKSHFRDKYRDIPATAHLAGVSFQAAHPSESFTNVTYQSTCLRAAALGVARVGRHRGRTGSMVDRTPNAPDTPVNLHIELGRARMRPDEADKLKRGSVVSLESLVDEPVDIVAGGRLIAKGEVLLLDGSFCIRVTKLIAGNQAA
jgi:flagellar motor switch protein FliN